MLIASSQRCDDGDRLAVDATHMIVEGVSIERKGALSFHASVILQCHRPTKLLMASSRPTRSQAKTAIERRMIYERLLAAYGESVNRECVKVKVLDRDNDLDLVNQFSLSIRRMCMCHQLA